MPRQTAYSPAGLSSFFQACLTDEKGLPIIDPLKKGSRGGGFSLQKGVTTEVVLKKKSGKSTTQVFLNNKLNHAPTSNLILKTLLSNSEGYDIKVYHSISVPSGSGFGTSGAGAFSLGLALNELLKCSHSYLEIAQMAHCAEIKAGTGLGTVNGLAAGNGVVLVREPGAPGIGSVDHIPVKPDIRVIALTFAKIEKASIIKDQNHLELINRNGMIALDHISSRPSLKNFLTHAKTFAENSNLMTSRYSQIIDAFLEENVIGAAVNMIGDAIHAVFYEDQIPKMMKLAQKLADPHQILVSPLSYSPAHLI